MEKATIIGKEVWLWSEIKKVYYFLYDVEFNELNPTCWEECSEHFKKLLIQDPKVWLARGWNRITRKQWLKKAQYVPDPEGTRGFTHGHKEMGWVWSPSKWRFIYAPASIVRANKTKIFREEEKERIKYNG